MVAPTRAPIPIGPNAQETLVWDRSPDGGGGPKILRMWSVYAGEACERAPARYVLYAYEDGSVPPLP
jgi:hypothetical protein